MKKTTIKKFKNPYGEKSKYLIEFSGLELFDIVSSIQDKRIYLENRSLKMPNDGIRYFSTNKDIEKDKLKDFAKRLKKLENDLRKL